MIRSKKKGDGGKTRVRIEIKSDWSQPCKVQDATEDDRWDWTIQNCQFDKSVKDSKSKSKLQI